MIVNQQVYSRLIEPSELAEIAIKMMMLKQRFVLVLTDGAHELEVHSNMAPDILTEVLLSAAMNVGGREPDQRVTISSGVEN